MVLSHGLVHCILTIAFHNILTFIIKNMAEHEAKKAEAPDVITSKDGGNISTGSTNTNAMICWLVVALIGLPIPSFIWMNEKDEELKWHAKTTLYFGLAIIAAYIIIMVVGTIGSMFVIGACCFLAYPLVWIIQVVVGVMGALKANKGERFEIPVIKDYVK